MSLRSKKRRRWLRNTEAGRAHDAARRLERPPWLVGIDWGIGKDATVVSTRFHAEDLFGPHLKPRPTFFVEADYASLELRTMAQFVERFGAVKYEEPKTQEQRTPKGRRRTMR